MKPLCYFLLFDFTLCLFLSGCAQQQETRVELPSIHPEATSDSCISAKAVVTYFLPEGRTYLTDQEHLFCPGSKALQISSYEPQGVFHWAWSGQQYTRSNPSTPSNAYWEQGQIAAVYAGFLYGGGFLPAGNLSVGEPMSLEGQRYIPLSMDTPGELLKVVLYQNQETNKIDRILVEDKAQKQIQMATLYNWSFYSPKKLLIPRKIDIFDIADGVSSKRLIIQIYYRQVP